MVQHCMHALFIVAAVSKTFFILSLIADAKPYSIYEIQQTCEGDTVSLVWNITDSEPNFIHIKQGGDLIGKLIVQEPSNSDNEPDFRSRFFISIESGSIVTLKILNVSLEDAEIYTCTATFGDGSPETSLKKQLIVRDAVASNVSFVLSEDGQCKIVECTATENGVYLQTPDGRLIHTFPFQLCDMEHGTYNCCVHDANCHRNNCKEMEITGTTASKAPDVCNKSAENCNQSSNNETSNKESSDSLIMETTIPCVIAAAILITFVIIGYKKLKAKSGNKDLNNAISLPSVNKKVEDGANEIEESRGNRENDSALQVCTDDQYSLNHTDGVVTDHTIVSVTGTRKLDKVDDSIGDYRYTVKDNKESRVDITSNGSNNEVNENPSDLLDKTSNDLNNDASN